SHPQHDLAKRQMTRFGGMVTAVLKGGLDDARQFLERCELFSMAESLGGVESLVCHPPTMTHAPVSAEALAEAGISQNLVRLSIGLEDAEDLAGDVLRALDAAAEAPRSVRPVAPVCAA
ncbi:MAG: PLP-dependent transferase, partial [Pseudomonadota bacterium]